MKQIHTRIDTEEFLSERCHSIIERGIRRLGYRMEDIINNPGLAMSKERSACYGPEVRYEIWKRKGTIGAYKLADELRCSVNIIYHVWRHGPLDTVRRRKKKALTGEETSTTTQEKQETKKQK